MKNPRSEHTCAELNGKIFVIGGIDRNSKELKSVEVLDVLSREWDNGPVLPENFQVKGCHVLKFEYDLYLIGGNGTVLVLGSNGTEWIPLNATIEPRTWKFLPAAKIKAGHCLKGKIFNYFHLKSDFPETNMFGT